MKTLIKPKKGLLILNPVTGLNIKAEGELVDLGTYWRRRLIDGDVELVSKIENEEENIDKKESKLGGKKWA